MNHSKAVTINFVMWKTANRAVVLVQAIRADKARKAAESTEAEGQAALHGVRETDPRGGRRESKQLRQLTSLCCVPAP